LPFRSAAISATISVQLEAAARFGQRFRIMVAAEDWALATGWLPGPSDA